MYEYTINQSVTKNETNHKRHILMHNSCIMLLLHLFSDTKALAPAITKASQNHGGTHEHVENGFFINVPPKYDYSMAVARLK